MSMPSAYQKTRPAAPAQPAAGEAFNPGLTPGVFSLEPDNHTVDQHERAHFPQQTALSVSYIPAHLLSQGIGGVVGSFTGAGFMTGTHRYNIFERWWLDVPSY